MAIEIARLGLPLCGWKKTPSGGEIDFLMPRGGRIVPVECKAGRSIDRRSLRGIADYLDAYDQPAGVIVSVAPLTTLEIESKTGRESRRVTLLPATLLERLHRVVEPT